MAGCVLGGVPEWLIGADCKSAARKGYAGSNPAPCTTVKPAAWNAACKMGIMGRARAHIAQLVEHVLGKNGVTSSNLVVGLECREV